MRIASLCTALLLYVFPVHAAPVFGDVNCDAATDILDVQLSILMALSLPISPALDADEDGVHDQCEVQGWACGPGTVSDPETGLCMLSDAACGLDTVWDLDLAQCVVDSAVLADAQAQGFDEGYAAGQADILLVTCGDGTELAPDGATCVAQVTPGTPCYEAGYEAGTLASATCLNGGDLVPQGDAFVCECPAGFSGVTCEIEPIEVPDNGTSFKVIESQDITYAEIDYVLLKVEMTSNLSVADNWCYEYENLCAAYDGVPTGCGSNFNVGGYGDCKQTYNSVGVSNSLGCNASDGVANAAKQGGYQDANNQNSFAFHSCGGSCQKEMCATGYCNTALSYVSMEVSHAYTLCKKVSGGCGIGTDVDINNCGACGNVCAQVANASVVCAGGKCTIDSCDFGYADCDGVFENGCEVNTMTDGSNCGTCGTSCGGEACVTGTCASSESSFNVVESQLITYQDITYTLLKVTLASNMSVAANWCYEYKNLCADFGGVPTGCGSNFNGGGYGDCKQTYGSDGQSNSLGCNASGGVANAAKQAGYGDANGQNSFAFHSCGSSCQKEMCATGYCNTALSYVSMEVPHAYTLCKMP